MIDPSERRLGHLFDISALLLAGSEGPEHVVPQLATILTREVAFSSAVIVLEGAGRRRTIDWHAEPIGGRRRRVARKSALGWTAYLAGRSHRAAPRSSSPSITLPLVGAKGAVFGAVHLEGVAAAGEAELGFVRGVVGILALALARTQRAREAESRALDQRAQWFLAQASATLAASLQLQATEEAVIELAVPALADACTIDLRGEGDDPPSSLPAAHVPIRTRVVLPLVAHGRTLGAITFTMSDSGRRYRREDVTHLETVAMRAALAIDNALMHQQEGQRRRAREDILAVVAHDLRSPLSVVVGGTSMFGTSDGPAQERIRAMIGRATRRMERLIDDLLDTASLDAGRLSMTPGLHRVDELLVEAIESKGPLPRGKVLEVTCDASKVADLSLTCDRLRILQVLANLLANAIKFTPDQGVVRLSAEVASGEMVFSVTDTGPGMSPAQVDRAFDRFWQARETSATGIGLGLSICKGIVELHRGRIGADSVPGKGSRFFFALPMG